MEDTGEINEVNKRGPRTDLRGTPVVQEDVGDLN